LPTWDHSGYIGHMERATISQIKNHLSAFLRKVRNGETILIMYRNRPIARLEGLPPTLDADGWLARLEAQGLIRRALKSPLRLSDHPAAPPDPEGLAVQALLEERESGR